MKKQKSSQIISAVFSALVLCFVLVFYAFGWTPPTAGPPENNVLAPINIGVDSQTFIGSKTLKLKDDGTGIFNIEGGLRTKGIGIFEGNVGIGTDIPGYKLDVSGTGRFTGDITADSGIWLGGVRRDTWPSGGGSSYWTQSGSNLYPENTAWNVGVGTTDPGAYKLNVAGNLKVQNVSYIGYEIVEQDCSDLGCTVNCPVNKKAVGGGCWTSDMNMASTRHSYPINNGASWQCVFSAFDMMMKAYAVCARVDN